MEAGKNQIYSKRNTKRRRSTAFNFFRQPSDERKKPTTASSENRDSRPVSRLGTLIKNNGELAKALEKSYQREADLKEQMYQLQNDNLELVSKLQCLKDELFIEKLGSVTQKRTFVKKLIEAVELMTKAAVDQFKEGDHDEKMDCNDKISREYASHEPMKESIPSWQSAPSAAANLLNTIAYPNEKLVTLREGCETINGERNKEPCGDGTMESRMVANSLFQPLPQNNTINSLGLAVHEEIHDFNTPDLNSTGKDKNDKVLLEEKKADLADKTKGSLPSSIPVLQNMEVCEKGIIESDFNSHEMDLEEENTGFSKKTFHVYEDSQIKNDSKNQLSQLQNEYAEQRLSKSERRILKRMRRVDNSKSRKMMRINRRKEKDTNCRTTRNETGPDATMRISKLCPANEDKENIGLLRDQKRIERLHNKNVFCSPVANVVRRMFSPLQSKSPLVRRESRKKRKVSYAEPSLIKKLRRGDPMTDSSLYNSPHFAESTAVDAN